MKRTLLATAVVAMLYGGMATSAHAAKHNDPPCSITPGQVTAGQAYTLSATGLPTVDPVYLIVTPPTGNSSVSEVYVSATGTWSGVEASMTTGAWSYTFSGLLGNKYGTVSSCSIQVN
jgi:hypothetical protein